MEKRLRDAQQTRVKSAAGLVQFADAAIASAALDAIREHRPIEVFLGLEVAENNSFVYAGGFRDLARAGAVEALLGKKLHRDVDELFLAIWRGKSHGTKVSAHLLYSHGNNSASLGFTVCHDGIDETYNQGFRCPNGRISRSISSSLQRKSSALQNMIFGDLLSPHSGLWAARRCEQIRSHHPGSELWG